MSNMNASGDYSDSHQIDDVIVSSKQYLDITIEKANNDIKSLDSSTDNSVNATKHINLFLYKLSAQCALLAIYFQEGKTIISTQIKNVLNTLSTIISFQEKGCQHAGIVLGVRELRDNFKYWNNINPTVFASFLKKEQYIFLQIELFLQDDRKWFNAVCDLYCKFVSSAKNFINVEEFLTHDANHYKTFEITKSNIYYNLQLCQSAMDMCIKAVSIFDDSVIFMQRSMQFLEMGLSLSNLLQDGAQIKYFKERKKVLHRKLNVKH